MKYAILIVETGEFIYKYVGSPTYRSLEEIFSTKDKYEKYLFSSKEAAEQMLNTPGQLGYVIINKQKVYTAGNLELFEIIEVNDETI